MFKSQVIGTDLHLTFRNNYGKSINGFYVMEGLTEATITDVELIYSDVRNEIAPGEMFPLILGAGERVYTEGVTIGAVMFTDGSTDGDLEIVRRMIDVRQGEAVQAKIGLRLLRESADKDFESRMAYLKSRVSGLQVIEEGRSQEYNAGLSYGRSGLTMRLNEIEKSAHAANFDRDEAFSAFQRKLERVAHQLGLFR